jgi:hypothetical protein
MERQTWDKLARPIVVVGIGASALTACSSSHSEPIANTTPSSVSAPTTNHPVIEATCTPYDPPTWGPVPENLFDRKRMAAYLGVAVDAVVDRGRYGSATCDKSFTIERISSTSPPVVSVPGEGSPCMALGVSTSTGSPVPSTSMNELLLGCANP